MGIKHKIAAKKRIGNTPSERSKTMSKRAKMGWAKMDPTKKKLTMLKINNARWETEISYGKRVLIFREGECVHRRLCLLVIKRREYLFSQLRLLVNGNLPSQFCFLQISCSLYGPTLMSFGRL